MHSLLEWLNHGIVLPKSVNKARSINSFKNRLDKFWSTQVISYDYEAPLTLTTGTRNYELLILDSEEDLFIEETGGSCDQNHRLRNLKCIMTSQLIERDKFWKGRTSIYTAFHDIIIRSCHEALKPPLCQCLVKNNIHMYLLKLLQCLKSNRETEKKNCNIY